MVCEMAALILKGSGGVSVSDAGVGSCDPTASLVSVSWETIASLVSVSAIGLDSAIGSKGLVVVVNWRMGIEAPLSGVIPIGGSDGPCLLWGVSIQSPSMWLLLRPIRGFS